MAVIAQEHAQAAFGGGSGAQGGTLRGRVPFLFPASCFSLFSPRPPCPSCVRTLAHTNAFDLTGMASAQRLKHSTQTQSTTAHYV